jgi:hypothetical protein
MADADEEEPFVQQITTGDPNAVKNLLDDYAITFIQDKAGYHEDPHLGDVQLWLMVFSCIVASIAQFLEKVDTSWAFPANRGLLFVCCSLYFIFSGILQYILSFIVVDSIIFSLPKANKPVKDCGIVLKTRFPRFSEFFTVILEWRDDPENVHWEEISVGKFFDFDGFFDEEAFDAWMGKVLKDFEDKASKK